MNLCSAVQPRSHTHCPVCAPSSSSLTLPLTLLLLTVSLPPPPFFVPHLTPQAARFFREKVDQKDGRAYESGHRDAINGIGWNSTGARLGILKSERTAITQNI